MGGQFFRGLKNSASQEVRVRFNFVARDLTTSAKNLKFVEAESGTEL